MTKLSQTLLPALVLVFLAGACINKQSDNEEVLKKLDALSQKLDSLKQSSSQVSTTDADDIINHLPGHIIDPPTKNSPNKPGIMGRIEVDIDIPGTSLKKGDIISGIDNREIRPSRNESVFFLVALDPKTNTYYAYDLCKICH